MDCVRRATAAHGVLDDAREVLKEAEKNDLQAFQAAVNNGGWTAEELRKIGLNAPEKVQRVQRRKKATKNTSSRTEGSPEHPEEPATPGT